MTWIVEDPLYAIVLGVIATVMFAFGWTQTNFRMLGYAACGTVLVTILLVVVERWVVTDNEQVEAALHEMARDVERNDLDTILGHVHPSAHEVRARVEAESHEYEFTRVDIKRNLKIHVDKTRDPCQATATFNVVVVGKDKSYSASFHQPIYVELTLQKDYDRWQVTGYHHDVPQRGLMRKQIVD